MTMPFRKLRIAIRKIIFVARNSRIFLLLWRHRRINADRLFRASWRALHKGQAGTIINENVYGISERDVLHYEYRQVFKYFFPAYSPEIEASDRDLLQQMTSKPCLIATVHAYNEFAICKLLDLEGLETAFVSHSPYDAKELGNYQIAHVPLNIPSTPKLFLDLRTAIRNGKYVICDVDFIGKPHSGPKAHFVSRSVFQFHLSTGLPLYFACNRVQQNGTITCFIGKAATSKGVSPDVVAQQFIAFVDGVQARSTNLIVGDWDELTKNKRHRYSMGRWTRNRVKRL